MSASEHKQPLSATNISRRRLLLLVALLLLLYVAVPRLGNFTDGFNVFWQAKPLFVLLCLVCTACTYFLTAGAYKAMAKHPIPMREITLVEAATALTNRLLPAGIGSMGLNAAYLQKRGHTLNQALSVVAANNTLGFVGHMLLFAVIFGLAGGEILGFHPQLNLRAIYITLAIIAVIAVNLVVFRKLRMRILRAGWSVLQGVLEYRERPKQASLALSLSMSLTTLYATTLYLSSQALGVSLDFPQIFLIFTVATFVGTITPTPGGLVGLEAALVAGFAAYGIDTGHALAITLLYRFATYWLPIIPGFFAFRHVSRHYL